MGDSKNNRGGAEPAQPAKVADLAPGQVVAGRYRVKRRIGQGGMGAVYAAEHVEFGRTVALKVLAGELSQQQDMLTRFRGEARAASQIGHPGIIDVFDFGTTDDGYVFFAMELLEGEDVAQVLAREARIGVARAARIIEQTAAAVGAAHAKGIVHRDLKPENIFLIKRDGREVVKVLDFGVAKATDPFIGPQQGVTGRGTVVGTPEYMSPEQASGNPVDARSDVYSLGCILYEMFVGKPPFIGKNFVTVLMKHIGQAPIPPHQCQPPADIPPALEKVILKALAKEPNQRYASMEELAAAVRQAAAEPDARGDDPVWLPQDEVTRMGRSSAQVPSVGDDDEVTTGPVARVPESAPAPPIAEPDAPPSKRTTGQSRVPTAPPRNTPVGAKIPTQPPTSGRSMTPHGLAAAAGARQRQPTPAPGSPLKEVTLQVPAPRKMMGRLTLIHALFALAIAILMVALVLLLKR